MAQLLATPFITVVDANGNPISGAVLRFSLTGSTTGAAVYSDSALGVSLGATVTCDSAGRAANGSGTPTAIYLNTGVTYRLRVFASSTDVVPIIDIDPLSNNASDLAGSGGAALIGYLSNGGTAVARTVESKLKEVLSVKDFGALSDGVTDASTAFQNALTYAGSRTDGAVVFVPYGKYYLASGITVPDKVVLKGDGIIPEMTPKGTVLMFANAVTTCITLTSGSNQSAGLRDLCVWRTGGSPPAGSIGVKCDQGSNIVLNHVFSANHGKCFYFKAVGQNGITGYLDNCFTSQALEDHIYMDSWPELTIIGGRYGINGLNDYNCTSYIHILGTDTSGSGGIGPNTLKVIGTQFNQGQNLPLYFCYFDDVATPFGNGTDFSFIDTHIEGVSSAGFKSNATTPYFYRVFFGAGCVFNNPTAPFIALNAATSIGQFEMNGAKIFASAFSINQLTDIGVISFIGGEITGAVTIHGSTTLNTNCVIEGTIFDSGLILTGKFTTLMVRTPSNISTMTAVPLAYDGTCFFDIKSYGGGAHCNWMVNRTQEWNPGIGVGYTPSVIGDMGFEIVSNTSVKLKLKGSDGTVRSVTLTLS